MSASIGSVYDITDFDYNDNEPGAIEKLQELNDFYRRSPWPQEYSVTTHKLRCSDAPRPFSFLQNESVHLIVTSPPYWTLKDYPPNERQLGAVQDYHRFLDELDKVWAECLPVICPRRQNLLCGRRRLYTPKEGGAAPCCAAACRYYCAGSPTRTRFSSTDPLVQNSLNGALEADRSRAGFYGKPYQPGAIVKNDFEYILFFSQGRHIQIPFNGTKGIVYALERGDERLAEDGLDRR